MLGERMSLDTRIISADDHVTAHPRVWQDRLPRRFRDLGPQVIHIRYGDLGKNHAWADSMQGDYSDEFVDVWTYEDFRGPLMMTEAAVGFSLDAMPWRPMRYDAIREGCYDPKARLADMDVDGIEASICFPNFFPRFAGQVFLDAKDKDLALLCVEAYNDFILDEWCAGSNGRLVPLGILPLWDVGLCVAEVDRVARRGMRAFTFPEAPARLGLPSIPSTGWDPLLAQCEDANVVIAMHIGSSPATNTPSPDASKGASTTLMAFGSAAAMIDWIFAGTFVRFPRLRICLAESEIGWIPYFLERGDRAWEWNRGWNEVWGKLPERPSSYFRDHVFCTFFDDAFGLANLEAIGTGNVMFETDYPHSDCTWPNTQSVAQSLTSGLTVHAREMVLCENARSVFQISRSR